MNNNTYTTAQIALLQKSGVDLNTFFAAEIDLTESVTTTKKTASKKPAKKSQPKALKAAKAHCYEARQARRSDASRKGGAGMTKQEKSELYAALVEKLGKRPTTAQWNAACKKARGI